MPGEAGGVGSPLSFAFAGWRSSRLPLWLAILTEAEVIKAIRRADEIAVKVANSA